MTIAIIATAVLAAMVFLLGLNVSRLRGATAKAGGNQMPTDPASPLLIAIRAHGNAAEYVPTLVVLFLLAGARSPAWVAIPLIVGATLSRLIHAVSMLTARTLAASSPLRMTGAIGTYWFGVALAVATVASLL